MRRNQEKTLELHRTAFETQEEADRTVEFWATRGIKIVWGVPTLEGAGQALKLPKDYPSRECPGCNITKPLHYAIWRRAIRANGMPGRFLMFCRKCEDNRAGRICRECKKHRPGSRYKQTDRGGTLLTCNLCRERPLEERRVHCTKCNKKRPGSQFRWKNEDLTITVGACITCERKYWTAIRKPKTKKECHGCKKTLAKADFPLGPNGQRRSWYCNDCTSNMTNDTPRECVGCHQIKPADDFGLSGYRQNERKSSCKKCTSRVQAYKNRRKREREARKA